MRTLSRQSLSQATAVLRTCAIVRSRWTDDEKYYRMRGSLNLVVFQCATCSRRTTGIVRPNPDGRGGNINLRYLKCRCGGEMERTDETPTKKHKCAACAREFRNPVALRLHAREAHLVVDAR